MNYKLFLSISLLALATISCGGGDDFPFFDNDTEVKDISVDDRSLNIGQGTVVRTKFSFDENDVFSDDDNVSVVIRLPEQLKFRLNTAEIQESGEDEEVGAQVFNCPTGEQYLLFDLDENDLSGAEDPSGDADAELTLTVDAFSLSLSGVVIEATASSNGPDFACGEAFESEESEVVVINP